MPENFSFRSFPQVPTRTEEALAWARNLTYSIQTEFFWLDDKVAKRITYGVTADKPASTGSGNLYFDTDLSTLQIDLDTGWVDAMAPGAIDHGGLAGLSDDDHTQYILADGTRAFSGKVAGISPTDPAHLATKEYVDIATGIRADYFFTDTAADIGGIYYYQTSANPGGGGATLVSGTLSTGDGQAVFNFVTQSGEPGTTTMKAGIYHAHCHIAKTTGTKPTKVYFEIYKRILAGTETLIATSEISDYITTLGDIDLHAAVLDDVDILSTDRIVIKWLANVEVTGSDIRLTLYIEGTYNSRLEVPTSVEVLSSVFVKRDGTTALSADWDAGGYEIRSNTFESDVATGTAPLVVASTTKVTNLNADLLDGNEASAFATSGHNHDHGGLTGLTDDDHTQYLLAAGTRALTADWDAGSFEVRAQTFESDVATGTAPLVVASTTKVTNLNADQLDGKDETAFVLVDGTRALSANWDAGSFEIRAQTFESDVATGTAPLTIASTTVCTNLNADLLDGKEAAAFPYVDGTNKMNNNVWLKWRNAANSADINVLQLDSANEIQIGSSGYDVEFKNGTGDYVRIDNAATVRLGDITGGAYVTIPTTSTTAGCILQSGTAPYISTANRFEGPEFRGKLWRTTQSKTCSDNVAFNMFQWDSATTQSVGFRVVYQVEVVYTQTSVTHYLIETGMVCCSMVNKSGTVTVGVGSKVGNVQANTGTGVMSVTFGSGTGSNYGRLTCNVDLTTGTWSAGEVRYAVVNTDTDNNALSLFG